MKYIILTISLAVIFCLQAAAQITGKQTFCANTTQTYTLVLGTGSNQPDHTIWSFGDSTEIRDDNTASGSQTRSYTYTKPGVYTIIARSFRADNTEIVEQRQTLKISVLSCVIPVNPNIHMYSNN